MTEYRYGEDAFIPPTQLRRALSVLYKDLERFQIGKIVRRVVASLATHAPQDDASEALVRLMLPPLASVLMQV